MVEETFDNLPLVHSTTCLFRERETPLQRIDYQLVESSNFKKLEGCWVLKPVSNSCTIVEVHSSLETGIHLPFAHKIANDINRKKCKERLQRIKTLAETSEHQHHIASSKI